MKMWTWFQPISFQAIWLCLIWGGNTWLPLSIAILALHFLLSPTRLDDVRVIPLALVGFAIDLFLTQFGLFSFAQWPLWLLLLWMAFILNLGHSMRFLRRFKLIYLVCFSALGGTYAYWVSWKLGAVELPYGAIFSLAIIAVNWSIVLPVCVKADEFIRKPADA
ncbi:DUF2878 domain-containing protein [Oceanospirillaceae bacterium]|nr:DUF2878 domain-containing protein [Oceanospirillaceae bacterium]